MPKPRDGQYQHYHVNGHFASCDAPRKRMLIDTVIDERLIPETLGRPTAEDNGEYETNPPSY